MAPAPSYHPGVPHSDQINNSGVEYIKAVMLLSFLSVKLKKKLCRQLISRWHEPITSFDVPVA